MTLALRHFIFADSPLHSQLASKHTAEPSLSALSPAAKLNLGFSLPHHTALLPLPRIASHRIASDHIASYPDLRSFRPDTSSRCCRLKLSPWSAVERRITAALSSRPFRRCSSTPRLPTDSGVTPLIAIQCSPLLHIHLSTRPFASASLPSPSIPLTNARCLGLSESTSVRPRFQHGSQRIVVLRDEVHL